MKIEIEVSEERYLLLSEYAALIEIPLDSIFKIAIYEYLRRNNALSTKDKKNN